MIYSRTKNAHRSHEEEGTNTIFSLVNADTSIRVFMCVFHARERHVAPENSCGFFHATTCTCIRDGKRAKIDGRTAASGVTPKRRTLPR
jgi:hypothetical protein